MFKPETCDHGCDHGDGGDRGDDGCDRDDRPSGACCEAHCH